MDTRPMNTGSDSCDPIPHTRPIMDYLRRTAIVEPSRTGGGDHGFTATRSGRSPMIFGGIRFQVDALCDPRRKSIIRRIVQTGGWVMRRDWDIVANYLSPTATRDADVCTGMVTA